MKRYIILTLILISLFVINGRSYALPPDSQQPVVTNISPAPGSDQVPLNSLISFDITDDDSGVNIDKLEVKVNGKPVFKDGTSPNGDCKAVAVGQKKRQYTIVYQSHEMFNNEQRLTITITAFDYAGNELKSYEYHIITEMRSFGQNQKVNSDLGNIDSSHPVTICDRISGNTWVAWQAGPGGNRDIYVSKLPKGADSFDSAVKLTNNANDQCNPAIALDGNGNPYIVWQDNRNGNWDIYLSTYDGTNWSAEIMVNEPEDPQTNPASNQVNPAIAIDDQSPNNAYVVWQDDDAGSEDVYIAYSSDGFTTIASQLITSNTPTSDQVEPAIVVDSAGTVYVVWTDNRNSATNGTDIYGAASNSNVAWENVPVVSDTKNQTSPVVAAEEASTILHLLWVDDTDPNGTIFYASTTDGLQGPLNINPDVVDEREDAQKEPVIFVTGSTGNDLRVYGSWQDWRNVDTTNPDDTDIYFAELSSSLGTNIFVGDGGTNSYQGEPAIGVCKLGFPYLVWTDGRNAHTDIYYAASTFIDPFPVWTEDVQHLTGANWGDDYLGKLNSPGDINIKIPPAAFPFDCDMTISASRIMNTNTRRFTVRESKGQFEFGPSGIQFKVPITIAIAYAPSSAKPEVYWYDPVTDTLKQDGITNVTYIEKANVHILKFKVRHFTSFYLVEGSTAPVVGGGGGGGGGGCAVSVNGSGNVIEYMLPYFFYITVLLLIKLKDTRNRKII